MMRSVSLSFEKRNSVVAPVQVRLLVLDERSGDVVTDLTLDPEQYTLLTSGQVLRVEEGVR